MISKPMIFDEVALGLRFREMPEEEVQERVKKVLEVCGLSPFIELADLSPELWSEKTGDHRLNPGIGAKDPDPR